jgi:light-regulated signal transduction histidine kinase (bacteriophytochrome)
MNKSAKVVALIETLHETDERLAELTAGEVDSVTSGDGRTSLLRQAQNQLRHSEAAKQAVIVQLQSVNEELEAFSYSVSHDLRAPLCHIQGFAELLQEKAGPALSADNLRLLTTIAASADQMQKLINELLEFSRTAHTELQKSDVNVGQLVTDVVGDFRLETAGRDIGWTIHPLPFMWADRALLRLALVNLISNALKYTGARVHTQIEIGCNDDDEDKTVLFIRDNGVGFDQKCADRLFGVFQRMHGAREFAGTGIGLANVRRIIHRHGGRTWAQGVVNVGATFYFSIPKRTKA